jgi:tetratricopeptide (TPR) repeat protein
MRMSPPCSRRVVLACCGVVSLGAGCATVSLRTTPLTPAQLRAEVIRRGLDPAEVVVPFEVDDEAVARARRVVADQKSTGDKARALARALTAADGFGLVWAPVVTTPAAETLVSHRGNCLALASVFIGLARAVGLDAVYVDASARVRAVTQPTPGLVVDTGHITAMVPLPTTRWYLDAGAALGAGAKTREIDDLEALAQFYNDRGFEHIDRAMRLGETVDWNEMARDFDRATTVSPELAPAWNNLGIARAHAGQIDEAEAAYRRAIAVAPRSSAAYNNLGSLYLVTGRAGLAVPLLRIAARLEPKRAHVHRNLARALLEAGETEAAERELDRAASLGDAAARGGLAALRREQAPVAQPL